MHLVERIVGTWSVHQHDILTYAWEWPNHLDDLYAFSVVRVVFLAGILLDIFDGDGFTARLFIIALKQDTRGFLGAVGETAHDVRSRETVNRCQRVVPPA